MPRTTALKVETLPADGVHKLVDCPFCEKKAIRSDHFGSHFETHVKKLDVSTALEFQTKFDNLYLTNQVLVQQRSEGKSVKNVCGVCFECHKFIRNKDKSCLSLDTFEEHVCREKKAAEKVLARMPPKSNSDEMKDLYTSMFHVPGLSSEIKGMMKMQKEYQEKEYSVVIQETFRYLAAKSEIVEKGFLETFCEKTGIDADKGETHVINTVLQFKRAIHVAQTLGKEKIQELEKAAYDVGSALDLERSNRRADQDLLERHKATINSISFENYELRKEIASLRSMETVGDLTQLQDNLANESARADDMQERYADLLRRAKEQGVNLEYDSDSSDTIQHV
tara:strand:- start:5171 stop:6184 length:1014 start_codon:yes stop_codon:yes gene_type:complete